MNMVVASAQISVEREHLRPNIEKHVVFIETAATKGADLIVFPEMSLTGYERERAKGQAVRTDDGRLSALRAIAAERHITAVVGAPVLIDGKLYIGSLIFRPSGFTQIYTKKYLHPGEELFFSTSSPNDPLLEINDERLSCAICFDIENAEHPLQAAARRTTVYSAGIFYSPGGMDHAHELLRLYARSYSMTVVMSNFCGRCWDMDAGGRSAIWAAGGEKLAEGAVAGEELLVAAKTGGAWTAERIRIG